MFSDTLKSLAQGFISSASSFVKKIIFWNKNKYSNQTEAKINPYTTCFSHCTCWFLQNISYSFSSLTPDIVTSEINSTKYLDWCRINLGDWAAKNYQGKLNQLWGVQLQYIKDKLFEKNISKEVMFEQLTTIDTIKTALSKSSVIVGTTPTYQGQKLGHIMLVVGYDEEKNELIIDDPFGDFRDSYAKGNWGTLGNDLRITPIDYAKIISNFSIYVS